MKRRILIVVNSAWFFLSHRLPIAREARDRGFEVMVACGMESPDEGVPIRDAGFEFLPLTLSRGSMNPLKELRTGIELYALYRKLRPALVHHVTIKPVLFGGIAARVVGVPAVVNAIPGVGYLFVSTGPLIAVARQMASIMYRAALKAPRTRAIFQNDHDLQTFCRAGLVRARDAVLIPGSGVDLSAYSDREKSATSETLSVLLPARMLRDKGVLEFAEASRLVKQRGLNARFLMAGRLDLLNPAHIGEQELNEICRTSGVEWLGNRADMPKLMQSCSVVCLPSYREGFPKALAEAAACARPVVTCAVPGCRDAIIPGQTGLLVPPRNAVALADALTILLGDPLLRQRYGTAGRALAEARFDVRTIARQQVDLYEELLR